MTVIPPSVVYDAAVNRADVVELARSLPAPDPDLANDIRFQPDTWARDIRYTRPVWCLQFSFKPLRIVTVDIPNKEGTLDRKQVWYLVYKIENTDASLGSEVDQAVEFPIEHAATVPDDDTKIEIDGPLAMKNEEGLYKPTENLGLTVKCVPQFVLAADRIVVHAGAKTDLQTGEVEKILETKSEPYVDRIIPLAFPAIMRREGFKELPETTVSITKKELKPGDSVWGVAMWTDIDPKIAKFSVYVSGLTNAYRWKDKEDGAAGAFASGQPLGTGRSIERRVLKLNWWKTGDEYMINDKEIKYGWPGAVDYEWVYR